MTNKIRSMIKIGVGLFIPFILIFSGCGPSNQEIMARERLASAKAAYASAKANPDVEMNAQIPLRDAGRAVELASQAEQFDEMEHLAYLAERKTQIAVAVAEEQMAEYEKTALGKETERLIVQTREREQRAIMEAKESNWEARASSEQARKSNAEAWAQTEKAQRAKSQARASDAQAVVSDEQARASRAEALSQTQQAQAARMQAKESDAQARASNEQVMASDAQARASRAETLSQTQQTQAARLQAKESDAQARASNEQAIKSDAEALSQTDKAQKATAEAQMLEQEVAAMKGRMTERGIVLTIGDVLFATGTATLTPIADNEIDKLAAFMKEYPDRNVLIEGYTDSTGTEGANLDLSLKRANAVSDKLVDRQISRSRITTRGFGEELPVAGNDTASGRERNRRVDVIILNEGVSPLTQK